MDKYQILSHVFGHRSFRDGQETLVDALIGGRDVLGVMPTGAGKSMCYQVPALYRTGVTLVISPLISLMKDQVMALKASGVPAAYLNSSLTPRQLDLAMERAREGQYRIIYVAPERLDTRDFRQFASVSPITMVAVDEAHCVSQWGQDFRPDYLRIADFVNSLPRRPVVGAFTATATQRVREDIVKYLQLQDPVTVTTGFDRPNLFFEVQQPKVRKEALRDIVAQRADRSGIVYCATRKAVEQVTGWLQDDGIRAAAYHAGMSPEARQQSQEDFQYDRVQVIVATNAFGMGIDKSNVRYVVHYNMPKSMEAYYQEAGRAGRDGEDAECILLYSGQDIITAKFLINSSENTNLTPEQLAQVRSQDMYRLNRMIDYATGKECLRHTIRSYFGEEAPERCIACSRCVGGHCDDSSLLEKRPRHRRTRKTAATRTELAQPAWTFTEQPTYAEPYFSEQGDLFDQLRACRMRLAKAAGVAPYIICSDKTLNDMIAVNPRTLAEMTTVYGLGDAKVKRYGGAFLDTLTEWRNARRNDNATPGSAKGWTEDQDDSLRRAYYSRVPIENMSVLYGRTVEEIEERLRDLGMSI